MSLVGWEAYCPSDGSHQEFGTVVTVSQDWKVNSEGEFVEELNACVEVVHGPDKDNVWTCITCGAEADFRRA